MAVDALVLRIAYLEAAFEQMDKRFGSLESRMESLERRMEALERKLDEGLKGLGQKIDGTARWLMGIVFVNWVTALLVILLHR